ncbi:quinoprotein dehydrogenase-associated SoxYZ-like carrier [Roseibium sediminis]|uniref:quinoprotein dehydrogenase-associated SoxYZ-like carrier n=1 Tax=Roseibium sediminis TaxID=1775174 RepID=UPI001AD8BFCD|nr:quinoprotein dehydrogenase-associated SoxYZ-like carrier [Roseibium sediminis]
MPRSMMFIFAGLLGASGFFLPNGGQAAESSWPDLRSELYGQQYIGASQKVVSIDAPYRTENDARTKISVDVRAPEGQQLKRVSLILDENPMPVSAQFEFVEPVPAFSFASTMRINGPTGVHAVAEMENGQLFMAEGFVKTSGLGACSAPPGTDPEEALATLGQMEMTLRRLVDVKTLQHSAEASGSDTEIDVDISHPSHSGMQMDQISLLYIPARYVDTLDIELNGAPYAKVTGSISLSENPTISFAVPGTTRRAKARLQDTDGTVSEVERQFADY